MIAFPAKLIASASLMSFWVSKDQIHPAVWISLYAILPICFNLFNVRRYGEIEFWLTVLKVVTCVGLIVLGVLCAMGATDDSRRSGTDSNYNLIPCQDPVRDNCVPLPGFACTGPFFCC